MDEIAQESSMKFRRCFSGGGSCQRKWSGAKVTGKNGIFPFKKEAASGKISRVPEAAFAFSKL
jgi:hypothetical protein